MNPQNQTPVVSAVKTTPKDFFLNLGAIIALYSSMIAVLNLIFSIINHLIPDNVNGIYAYFAANGIAWPISVLIIFVPLLYILGWFIHKDVSENPEKKQIWVRRWRIHLTLFLTGAAIATDLVVLVNVYLNGEVTARFIWKVLAVLVVCGAAFKYYFFTINDSFKISRLARQANAAAGIIIVLAAIIGGFLIVGSPSHQRALRFDAQRVNDLQNIQYQVLNYWQNKGKLPASLADMKNSFSGYIPMDPDTKAQYEYSIKSDKSFDLCATFVAKSDVENQSQAYPVSDGIASNWKHEAGHACFTRTIDPELYPQSNMLKPIRTP